MRDDIIRFLKQTEGFVSGEEISRRFHITRAAIWKNIEEWRRCGYVIEAVSNVGYRLQISPDKFFPWEVQEGLRTKILGARVEYSESVDSTMTAAMRLAVDGEPEGTVVFAERQTHGRGRMGRAWVSPKGVGIYFSIILRPDIPLREASKLTLLSAVAVCEAVREFAGVEAGIKWPNDILIGKNKLAGILTEMNAELDQIRFVILGIGLNVNTPRSVLPSGGTSLKIEASRAFRRVDCVQRILERLEFWYDETRSQGFCKMLDQWRALSTTLGQHVVLNDGGGEVSGKATDIDEDGALLIKTSSGKVIRKFAGDVVHC